MKNQSREGKKPTTGRQDSSFRSQSTEHTSNRPHRTKSNSNRHPTTYSNAATSSLSSVNMHPQNEPRVCEYFVTTGTCKFGEKCKFDHPAPAQAGNGQQTLSEHRPQALLFKLKGCIKAFSRMQRFRDHASFENYLDLALKVLDSSDRQVQSEGLLVLSRNDFKDDDRNMAGYDVIRHIVEHVGNVTPAPLTTLELEKHLLPLMNIIVHDAFTKDCFQKNFRYVIKAVYGADGGRAVNFLTKVIGILEQQTQSSDLEFITTVTMQGCFLASRILFYLARYNSEALDHEGLVGAHARLLEVSMSVSTPISGKVKRILDQTTPHLISSTVRPAHQPLFPETSALSNHYERYEILVDLPGILSKSCPRHDNDSHEISKISILPTKAEVLCPREPYLPINDIRAPHFLEGPARLFDIHFRLLREDMIGPLRTAVTTILDRLRPNLPISKQLSPQNRLNGPNVASTRLYYKVTIDSFRFDQKCGLNFRLRFRQPDHLQQSKDQRTYYWSTTKSLAEGSLLALISNAPDFLCFLTVLKREPKLLDQDQHWCYIDVVPEGKSRDELREYLVNQARVRQPTPDSLALVEFPGILLASYSTILKTLQSCSKHPYLPFSNILCPRSTERLSYSASNQVINVQPPLYALDAAPHPFQYDLQPLKRTNASDTPLLLSVNVSIDDCEFLSRLERETTLDSGQCQSLVGALTREISLIQGPHLPVLL